jgi:hypothetical protein
LKILHIWDQAGVACILAKHHRRMGHEVRILKRTGYDPFGISQFYNEPLLDMDGKTFLKYAMREAAGYDVVHVHTIHKVIPDLHKKYPDKKLILHYHGSEARDGQRNLMKAEAESKADVVLGSTEDLKEILWTTSCTCQTLLTRSTFLQAADQTLRRLPLGVQESILSGCLTIWKVIT